MHHPLLAPILATLALATFSPTAPAPAQKEETKKQATAAPFEILGAVNGPVLRFDTMANEARVFCFVKLKENESLFYLEKFDQLSDEFAFDPVEFVAISSEPKDEVEKTVKNESVVTPILLAGKDAGVKDYGLYKFPGVIVVDGAGKIRFSGFPGDPGAMRDAIREAMVISNVVPDLPAASKPISKLFERYALGDATKAIEKDLAKPKLAEADKAKLEGAKARAGMLATRLSGAAKRFEKAEDWPRLVIALSRLDKDCVGMPEAEGAKARLDALKSKSDSDKAFAAEFNVATECAKAERFERDKDWKKAYSTYAAAAKTGESKSAKYAANKADGLKQRAGVK